MKLSQLRKAINGNHKSVYIPKDATKVKLVCAWCGKASPVEKWDIKHNATLICPCGKPYSLHFQHPCEEMKYTFGIIVSDGTCNEKECKKISDQQHLDRIDNYIGTWYAHWHFTVWWGSDDIMYDLKMEAGKEYHKLLSPEFDIDDEIAYVALWLKCHDWGAKSTTRQENIAQMKKWLAMLKKRKTKGNTKLSDMRMIKLAKEKT